MGKLEERFDVEFTAALAQSEKQIQQNYRPIIGVHKWFARRPGTVFRNLLMAEFNGDEKPETGYWRTHNFRGVVADPFMGGGTPIYEANRLGFSVVGTDVNPMAYWIVRQSLAPLNLHRFIEASETVIQDVEREIADYYQTQCLECGGLARAKYFIWVKTQLCPHCNQANDLFPGYLLSEATRHPRYVVACGHCGDLNEYDSQPTQAEPGACKHCGHTVYVEGPANGGQILCRSCSHTFSYPPEQPVTPPTHRMWAIEYHCEACKSAHKGRFFKEPDSADLNRFARSASQFDKESAELPFPKERIPDGDETNRLHRWGYKLYRQMFNERQLLGLGLLLRRIMKEPDETIRNALLTVFSDFLRYQNMLCRYDTYALKCQDIFSVHGFPVGLVQCEDNLLGIPKVGSGAFRHFIEKYRRAKEYCVHPFETQATGGKKKTIPIAGERIEATFVHGFPKSGERQAWLESASATAIELPPNSLDGVFTDPPYYDNVQYAELIDFCFVWLRIPLSREFPCFKPHSTRSTSELTGNDGKRLG
jgi:adenine-specific DNA methylase